MDNKLALVVVGDKVTIRGVKNSPVGTVVSKVVVTVANQRMHRYTVDFGGTDIRQMYRGQFDKA